MSGKLKSKLFVCTLILLGVTGCSMEEQSPWVLEMNSMTTLDGGTQSQYGPQSPVMQDVYDRSIPEEVYSEE